jgi:hypothetical protein
MRARSNATPQNTLPAPHPFTLTIERQAEMARTLEKKKKRKKKDPGDSPIMVGGGGGVGPMVELKFDHNDYVPDPDDRDNFINTELALNYIQLVGGDPIRLPANSEIVVEYKKGGSTGRITVEADPPTVPLGVKFNPKKLKYNHQSKKHRDDGLVLKNLTINGRTDNLGEMDVMFIHTMPANRRRSRAASKRKRR